MIKQRLQHQNCSLQGGDYSQKYVMGQGFRLNIKGRTQLTEATIKHDMQKEKLHIFPKYH
jgi:hypothetical protein